MNHDSIGRRGLRVVAAVTIGVTSAWLVGLATRPWEWLPDDQPVAIVSASCSISRDVLDSARTFEEVRRVVVTVPVELGRGSHDLEFREAACDIAVASVRDAAPWFHALPRDWICEQLARDGARFHAEHFSGVPAYLLGAEPIDVEQLDATLAEHHLARRRGLIVPTTQLGKILKPRQQPEVAPRKTGYVRGRDVGL